MGRRKLTEEELAERAFAKKREMEERKAAREAERAIRREEKQAELEAEKEARRLEKVRIKAEKEAAIEAEKQEKRDRAARNREDKLKAKNESKGTHMTSPNKAGQFLGLNMQISEEEYEVILENIKGDIDKRFESAKDITDGKLFSIYVSSTSFHFGRFQIMVSTFGGIQPDREVVENISKLVTDAVKYLNTKAIENGAEVKVYKTGELKELAVER